MDIEELFLTRQSTREYSSRPVTDEELEKICRLALLAPSAVNAQPYRLYAVSGERAKEFAVNVQLNGANAWASDVPAFVVVEKLPPRELVTSSGRKLTNEPFIAGDVGILVGYLTIAAESMGVQSCILGIRNEKGIAEFLGLPENTAFPLVIALGHAANGYAIRQKSRRKIDEAYKLVK